MCYELGKSKQKNGKLLKCDFLITYMAANAKQSLS